MTSAGGTNGVIVTNYQGDPYPLLSMSDCSYREAQIHASQVDSWLGLETAKIESALSKTNSDQELWIGLKTEALLTPYIEFRQILEKVRPKPGDTVIDCGAGYGRMGFVIGAHYPGVNFIGFEIVAERVSEGAKRLSEQGFSSAQLLCANIDSPEFILPEAETYFVYDFSHRAAIDRLLLKLQALARKRSITVVARGRSSRDAIDHGAPWLSQVVPPEHFQNFSIYRS